MIVDILEFFFHFYISSFQ